MHASPQLTLHSILGSLEAAAVEVECGSILTQRQAQGNDTQRALVTKTPVLSKERSEEIFNAVADDQLDIPAFLRRQAN
jgi:cell division protein FtsZ